MIEETYPSGRKVKNTLDANGDLSQVQSKKNANYGYWTYAGSFSYNTVGAVTKMQLGNGRWETAAYNDRTQIEQIGLGGTDSTQDLLKLELNYGTNTQNNGSLHEQKITVPTVGQTNGFTAIQTYTYDSLNRIGSAKEMVGTTETWKQTFIIDRYGNRRFNMASGLTTTLGTCTDAVCNPEISTVTNRFTTPGYGYDKNGNVTQDVEGRQFLYDAENHQKEVKDASNVTIGEYLYDGEGRRVKKVSNIETTIFVYNASGQLVAEYSTQMAQTPQVSYLTTDHLGSARVITNENGEVTTRKDFTAFGEESLTPERVGDLGYTGNGEETRKGYTGYEKDDESGLDFAQARYYNSIHGRYTSVDPLTASVATKDPQTFNRYSYVLNSPYKFTDSLGLLPENSNSGCNFGCRVTNAINGNGSLSEADRELALFHIRNGTALGYAFLDASYAAIQRQQAQRANIDRRQDQYYEVSGNTAAQAMSNADVSKANKDCDVGYAGCADVKDLTNKIGRPGTGKAKKVKNGYQVTENPFSPQVSVQITVYLPKWTGYDSASASEKAAWDKMMSALKDHEEGHVDILTQEANRMASDLAKALPESRTFTLKSGTDGAINAAVTARYRNANKVVAAGWNRWNARNKNYDVVTGHGRISRSTVKY